jgi:PAS domain S-box-containing protein
MLDHEFSLKTGDLQRRIAELQQRASGAEIGTEIVAEALEALSVSLEALLFAEGTIRGQNRERDMLQAIVEETHIHLAYLDPQFNFVWVNDAYALGSGHSKEELLGHNHFELFPNPENQAIFEQARDTGQPVEFQAKPFEYADQPERGTTYWDWSLVPVKDGGGQVQGLVLSLQEVTERKRAEEALRQARDELEIRVRERTAELVEANEMLQAEINERRRVEEELRSSEEQFRQLAENINEVFWMSDRSENQILYVSPAYERVWGRPREHLYQRPGSLLDGVHPEDRERVIAFLEKQFREESDDQCRIVQPDGSLRWIRARAFPIRDELGEVYRVAGIAEDITERVQAYQSLEQRVEERTRELSTLLEISRHVALTLELEPLLNLILEQLEAVMDYDDATVFKLEEEELIIIAHRGTVAQEEMLPQRFSLEKAPFARQLILNQETVIIPDVRGDTLLARDFRDVTDERFETVYGQVRSWMGVPLTIKDQVTGMLTLKHSEPNHYTPSQVELVLAFANQAAVAIENTRLYEQAQALAALEERQRLARDLHDAVSQTLFSASLAAEVLPRLWERKPDEGRRCLKEIQQLTRGALAEMRTLLLELRPSGLLEAGLDELLRQLVEAASSRARLPITLNVEGQCALAPDVQVNLYRIAQEALSNVVKHAGASRAAVSLRCAPLFPSTSVEEQTGRVELHIEDDGRGFEPAYVPADCLGLCIMQERAEAIGAAMRIKSQTDHGTRLEVVWPSAL